MVSRRITDNYSQDGPEVLHDLSFEIKAGERVGIVGRTGSGKSSLTLSLLRCIVTEGEVYYDGLPISSMNLDSLRKHITIIPQMVNNLLPSTQYSFHHLTNYSARTSKRYAPSQSRSIRPVRRCYIECCSAFCWPIFRTK